MLFKRVRHISNKTTASLPASFKNQIIAILLFFLFFVLSATIWSLDTKPSAGLVLSFVHQQETFTADRAELSSLIFWNKAKKFPI